MHHASILAQFGSLVCIIQQTYGSVLCTMARSMLNCIHSSLHDVHQAPVWLNAVHQASIWLNALHQASIWLNHGINYSSMLCIRHKMWLCILHQYGLMLCIHSSMMCTRHQYSFNAVYQASIYGSMLCIRHLYDTIWLNVVQASIYGLMLCIGHKWPMSDLLSERYIPVTSLVLSEAGMLERKG